MRIQVAESDMESSGDLQASNYTMNISGHAFTLLSKGLYSDPILAIVRELSCNAWDSHTVAGNTAPFEVYLPNHVEPTFALRDFGTGLSEENINIVYKSYFTSTKQQSDTTTGCFGLGSKSPFAYTNMFTMKSYFNGKLFHYANVRKADGVPDLVKMSETDTTEPNGVEVSFAVKPADFGRFYEAARKALRWFKVRPTVKGLQNLDAVFPEREAPMLEGEGWCVRGFQEDRYDSKSAVFAVMGNVEYPIAAQAGMSQHALKIIKFVHCTVEFPIGSFEVTPSRETIQWSDVSIQAVNDRLEDVYDSLFTQMQKDVDACATKWQACYYLRAGRGKIMHMLGFPVKYNGEPISPSAAFNIPKGFSATRFTTERRYSRGTTKYVITDKCPTDAVSASDYNWWFVDAYGHMGAIENMARQAGAGTTILVTPLDAEGEISYDPARLSEFCQALGIDSGIVRCTSSLPTKAHTPDPHAKSKMSVVLFDRSVKNSYAKTTTYWKEAVANATPENPAVYMWISNWVPMEVPYINNPGTLRERLNQLELLGLSVPQIYGIRTAKLLEEVKTSSSWVHFEDWVKPKLLEIWDSNPILQVYVALHVTEGHEALAEIDFEVPEDSYLAKWQQQVRNLKTMSKYEEAWTKVTSPYYYVDFKDITDTYQTIPYFGETIQERYPLLDSLHKQSHYTTRSLRKELGEYVTLIDRSLA